MTNTYTIGDRSRKSKFDPDLARRVNEEVEQDERPEPVVVPPRRTMVGAYANIDFEERAYRLRGATNKTTFRFDKSLERLHGAGFKRHARPWEVFGLLVDNLEGKLSGILKGVADDMLNSSYGELLSLAWERQGDVLVAYVDPGLVWNADENKYVHDVFGSYDRREFPIDGKQSRYFTELGELDDEFVRFHYSRPLQELPEEIREGTMHGETNMRARVTLPPEGVVLPVIRVGWYGLSSNDTGSSRGVRKNTMIDVHTISAIQISRI